MSPVSPSASGTVPIIYGPFTDPDAAAGAQAVNRSSVAALAFLVWDILITYDDEVKYMWPRPWSYTKVVYVIARYLPLMVETSILLIGSELTPHFHFTPHDCYIWQVYQGVSAAVIVIAVDTILILRVYALFHGNRPVHITVGIFFGIEIICVIVGLALALPGVTYDGVCLVVSVPATLLIYAGGSIVFQSLLFGLTTYKFVQAVRTGWNNTPLVKLLMRDGTWAFFLLFFVYIGQVGLYGLQNHAFSGVLYGWLLTAFSFCGYRILLNLGRLADPASLRDTEEGNTNAQAMTGTNIEFTSHIHNSDPLPDSLPLESFELSPTTLRDDPKRPRSHDRTFATTEISTLSLGH